jgi:hypothetical protein
MGAFLYARSGEEVPDGLGPPAAAMAAFHRRATECLILSKYFSSPGPYTIEALLVNQQFEFMRTKDARLGVWLMGGTIIRLAFRMGYHRDPDAYPRISVHQGEIRRRIWALILQLDALTSYQMGLPAMVQDAHCDTKPPRNLFDEDFGPDTKQLPPSRPESEVTPILYVINKVRISACFREIYSRVALGGSDDYAEIMALHQRLLIAHDSVSPRLQLSNLQDTVTVQPHLLLRRCMLELLFLKCLCILHRRHMTKSFTQAQFSQSRSLCVEAAMSILAIQSDMLDEKKYGPILRASKGLISSLEQTDFILAATIICLELSSGSPEIPQTTREHPKFTRTRSAACFPSPAGKDERRLGRLPASLPDRFAYHAMAGSQGKHPCKPRNSRQFTDANWRSSLHYERSGIALHRYLRGGRSSGIVYAGD